MTACKERKKEQGGKLTTNCQVFKNVLEMYATDEAIAEAEAETDNPRQLAGMTAFCYFEALFVEERSCGSMYNEQRLKALHGRTTSLYPLRYAYLSENC